MGWGNEAGMVNASAESDIPGIVEQLNAPLSCDTTTLSEPIHTTATDQLDALLPISTTSSLSVCHSTHIKLRGVYQ